MTESNKKSTVASRS